MTNNKRTQWRRYLTVAYSKPLKRRWRPIDVPVFPGWLFDAAAITTCALLASGLYLGWAGVIGALLIPILFLWLRRILKSRPRRLKKPAGRNLPPAAPSGT